MTRTSTITPSRIPADSHRGDGLGCRCCRQCRHPHGQYAESHRTVRRAAERRNARRSHSRNKGA
jgi:hypothetical protein